jgi:hypothetical protein
MRRGPFILAIFLFILACELNKGKLEKVHYEVLLKGFINGRQKVDRNV